LKSLRQGQSGYGDDVIPGRDPESRLYAAQFARFRCQERFFKGRKAFSE
jgi:hypothetical protein